MSYGVLQHLFDSLAAEACNPVTPTPSDGVTPEPAPMLARTLVTPVTPPNDETDLEAFEERAAILEFDAGLPRHEAELLAAEGSRVAGYPASEQDTDTRVTCTSCANYSRARHRCGTHRAALLQGADIAPDFAALKKHCPGHRPATK